MFISRHCIGCRRHATRRLTRRCREFFARQALVMLLVGLGVHFVSADESNFKPQESAAVHPIAGRLAMSGH